MSCTLVHCASASRFTLLALCRPLWDSVRQISHPQRQRSLEFWFTDQILSSARADPGLSSRSSRLWRKMPLFLSSEGGAGLVFCTRCDVRRTVTLCSQCDAASTEDRSEDCDALGSSKALPQRWVFHCSRCDTRFQAERFIDGTTRTWRGRGGSASGYRQNCVDWCLPRKPGGFLTAVHWERAEACGSRGGSQKGVRTQELSELVFPPTFCLIASLTFGS